MFTLYNRVIFRSVSVMRHGFYSCYGKSFEALCNSTAWGGGTRRCGAAAEKGRPFGTWTVGAMSVRKLRCPFGTALHTVTYGVAPLGLWVCYVAVGSWGLVMVPGGAAEAWIIY